MSLSTETNAWQQVVGHRHPQAEHAAKRLPVRRVAVLSVHTCPLAMLGGKKTGGMNVYVRDFACELARQGVQVDVFTRSQDDCQPRINHELGCGGRVIHIPAGPEVPLAPMDVYEHLDEFVAGVLRFAHRERAHYDLIHSHYWLSGLVAEELRLAWLHDHGPTPIIHMFHTLGHMKNLVAQSEGERAPQARLDGETQVMRLADRLIAATPAEREQLTELYGANGARIRVIPPGVDLARFRPIDPAAAKERVGIPPTHRNVVFAGRIEPLKGIDTLLEAVAILRREHPDAVRDTSVTIIGGDPWADDLDAEMARLQEMRCVLGLHDLVTFAGAKDQAVLPFHYAAAEMVVVPSHYESFGMVALESMAMGTPVIASEVGGLAHLLQDGETGFHVPAHDPAALAERMLALLTDEPLRERLGRQARQHAQRYDWRTIVKQLLHTYGEVLTEI